MLPLCPQSRTVSTDGINGGSIVEMAAMFKQLPQHMTPVVTEAVSPEQFLALQSRLESLHAAGLMTDEELLFLGPAAVLVPSWSSLSRAALCAGEKIRVHKNAVAHTHYLAEHAHS